MDYTQVPLVLVSKWPTHCRIVVWGIRVRRVVVNIACTDTWRFFKLIPLIDNLIFNVTTT